MGDTLLHERGCHVAWHDVRRAVSLAVDTAIAFAGRTRRDLPIRRGRGFCSLTVRVPREPGLTPPGWYMLFITDTNGVPSTATWVHVTAY